MPEPDPIAATPAALLLHDPPPVGSVKVVVAPTQTVEEPMIAEGNAFTVTTAVLVQPLAV